MYCWINCIVLIVGCYRDDGLAITRCTPRQADILKKKLCKLFRDNGLSIDVNVNAKVINFLDVTFDLSKGIFKPFRKPNDVTNYVHMKSNHPPSILKNIPTSVNKRLSSISANREVFDEAAPPYQEALDRAGYNHKLEFAENVVADNNNNGRKKRNRNRKIIYFNPPFNLDVETKIGREFLKIIDKSFPVGNPLRSKLTRHNMKLSYSTTTNMRGQISRHNTKLLAGDTVEQVDPCVCRDFPCPLNDLCETRNVIYQASVTTTDDGHSEHYVGVTNHFKSRFGGHRSDLNHSEGRKNSTLAKYVWDLKDAGRQFDVNWRIIDRGATWSNVTRRCQLCDKEKFYIIYKRDMACRHRLTNLLRKAK